MCGICGVVASSARPQADEATIRRMCRTLSHRGPDSEGYYCDEQAMLGMRRLSIIDLETGEQPVTNEDRSLWLVFNGEIYNYREIRRELQERGHEFASKGDSEVLVHAYEEYGDQCVDHLNGMFAFAIWDVRRRRLLLARDRLGIKPLYYLLDGDSLMFGSELKALLAHPRMRREIDPVALDHFLTLEYVPGPRTIFKDARKLPPGYRLIFADGVARLEQYWDVPFRPPLADERVAIEMLAGLLKDAVRMQLVSDVPLGIFLSGGLDSSTVVACASQAATERLRTFSIGFSDETYNELPYARAVASRFGTEHHEEIQRPDIAALAEQLVAHMDEPFADFSIFPTFLVSKLASQSVKVVLSGDGGDELFGGYDAYVAQQVDRYYRWMPEVLRERAAPALMDLLPPQPAKKGFINKAKRMVEGGALPPQLQHTRWMMFLSDDDKARLYRPDLRSTVNGNSAAAILLGHFDRAAGWDSLAQEQYVDIKTYLVDDILTKVDRMSMAPSVEARVPLLDHRIVEFAVNLAPRLKLNRGQRKVALRRAMRPYLPDIVLNKPKQGFSIPLKHWLSGPLQPLMRDLLAPDSVRRRGYFQPETVSAWMQEHVDSRRNHSHRLWALMVFELWHRGVMA
jgi:asparagine synthase (glutamine-hydrolysing)